MVSPGDAAEDLSYASPAALALPPSAEIVDASGAAANTTLPVIGSPLSVTGGEVRRAGGALVVDTSNVVLYVTSSNPDGTYYAGDSIFVEARSGPGKQAVCPTGDRAVGVRWGGGDGS